MCLGDRKTQVVPGVRGQLLGLCAEGKNSDAMASVPYNCRIRIHLVTDVESCHAESQRAQFAA